MFQQILGPITIIIFGNKKLNSSCHILNEKSLVNMPQPLVTEPVMNMNNFS